MQNLAKLFLFLTFISSTILGSDFNIMVDNQSSCEVIINQEIPNNFSPLAPKKIRSHSYEVFPYKIDEKSVNQTIFEYYVHCSDTIISAYFGIRTEEDDIYLNIVKYYANFDNKIKVSIDQSKNFKIIDL